MSERITLNELEKIKKAPNNLFIDDKNNIFLQKGMIVKKEELEILKKWKIETFTLKDRINIGIENFTSLFFFEKDKVAKTYKQLLNRIENYYNSVSKQYKLGLPEFQDELESLFNMETSQMYYFLFYLHCYQKTNRLEEVVLRSSVYALFIAKRMGKNLEECNNVFEYALISEIGYIEKSEKTMESTLKEMADVLDFQYLKHHVSFGFKTAIENLGYDKKSSVNILTHHDYMDGSGFNKITGDKLSLESLIITVAQEFTYLTTEFIQEKSPIFDFPNGILQLVRKKERYKKEVLDAFISIMSFYPPGTLLYMSNDKLAFSINCPTSKMDRPRIEFIADKEGKVLQKQESMDLFKENEIEILGIVSDTKIVKKIIRSVYGK